jgi:hypothetical protein
MDAEDIIPTFPTSNLTIGIGLPNALTITRLRSYKMFEEFLIVAINSVGFQ